MISLVLMFNFYAKKLYVAIYMLLRFTLCVEQLRFQVLFYLRACILRHKWIDTRLKYVPRCALTCNNNMFFTSIGNFVSLSK